MRNPSSLCYLRLTLFAFGAALCARPARFVAVDSAGLATTAGFVSAGFDVVDFETVGLNAALSGDEEELGCQSRISMLSSFANAFKKEMLSSATA